MEDKLKKKLLFGNNRTIHSGYLHGTSSVKIFIKLSPSGSMLTDPCIIPRIFQNKEKEGNMNLILKEINSLENALKVFHISGSWTRFTLTSTVNYGLFPFYLMWWTVLWKQLRFFNCEIIILICDTKNAASVCQARC